MPILKIRETNVYFIHIPKTGGETVERYLAQVGSLGFFWPKMDQTLFQCTPQHFDVEMMAPLFPKNYFDYRFAVVRHPLDRVVSEYKMRVRTPFSKGRKIPSFEAWFMQVLTIMARKPRVLDNHMNQQFKFVDDTTKVFKFEDGIIENLKQVQQDLGVEFDFSKNIHRQNSPKDIVIEMSDKTILKIADLYAEDFEAFGYKMEDAGFFKA